MIDVCIIGCRGMIGVRGIRVYRCFNVLIIEMDYNKHM